MSFNRNQEAFKPPTLIPAKELVKRLMTRPDRHMRRGQEEADKHPDDREDNDFYVNEMPDADEKDYKEPVG
ncbi:unnamed protein product [Haemonchus placei]|uniref:Uncharacterized protein n=1 Tax=Haemonchus placei TaxID=6290 RepID=A0A3P8CTM5_HAEPC|nr:unnamed protein product [Haemonchus placei]